jgi:DNA polymerase-3 subunit alpha
MRPVLPNIPPLSEHERLTKEKEIIGFYISGHPLEPFRAECEVLATHQVSKLGTWQEMPITIAVVVTMVRKQISKKSGNEFARLTVEDFSGASEVLVFPEAWAAIGDRVVADVPVLIKGGYSKRDQGVDNPTFIVDSVTRLAELRTTGQLSVSLEIGADAPLPVDVIQDVKAVCESHPGSAPLEVRWNGSDGSRATWRSASLTLSPASAALLELRALLGPERVRLVRGS